MKILLIEDDDAKKKHIVDFLTTTIKPDISCIGSVNSAVKLLRSVSYDCVITDMSLPTFETTTDPRGGRPQGFGGREIIRQMNRFHINTPVIVMTQFSTFDDTQEILTIDELSDQLSQENNDNYLGLVFFNSAIDNWKNNLLDFLNNILPK